MEEDIKILEEFIEAYKIAEEVLDGDVIQSIDNLVTRYKQLEEENTQLKTITQEYNSYLQDSNCDTKIIIADSEYFANGYLFPQYLSFFITSFLISSSLIFVEIFISASATATVVTVSSV